MGSRFRGNDSGGSGGVSSMTELTADEFSVPSAPGIDIYVRNKRPAT